MAETGVRTVGVTGATGFVGRAMVRALLDAGHRVRALVRDRAKASDALPTGDAKLQMIVGDIFDAGSRRSLLDGADAVVHTIGIRREMPPDIRFDRMHVDAVRKLLASMSEHGIDRLVHMSAAGVRANAPTEYHRSKWEAEELIRDSGIDWTILRPTIIHGPDGEFMRMIKDWSLGRSAPYVFLPYFKRFAGMEGMPPEPKFETPSVEPVAVEDVAGAAVRSLATPKSIGEVYLLAGPERLTWPELLEAVRSRIPLASQKKPIVGIPGHLGWIGAKKAKIFGMSSLLPFGESEPIMAMEDSVADTTKAAAHLDFSPRGFVTALDGYAARI